MNILFCSPEQRCRADQRGFTLIEAMVVLAISAILAALAAPSMRSMIERNGVAGSVNSFIGSINFARSEALKRGMPVSMCRSVDAETTTSPQCTSGANWDAGWIVYADADGNSSFDGATGDVLLRVQGSLARSGVIVQNTSSHPSLDFAPTGWMTRGMSSFVFCSPSEDLSNRRTAAISKSGRAQVAASSATDDCK